MSATRRQLIPEGVGCGRCAGTPGRRGIRQLELPSQTGERAGRHHRIDGPRVYVIGQMPRLHRVAIVAHARCHQVVLKARVVDKGQDLLVGGQGRIERRVGALPGCPVRDPGQAQNLALVDLAGNAVDVDLEPQRRDLLGEEFAPR